MHEGASPERSFDIQMVGGTNPCSRCVEGNRPQATFRASFRQAKQDLLGMLYER